MDLKDTLFSIKQTINCGGTLLDLTLPRVMGILNITPDSFYDGGRYVSEEEIVNRAMQIKLEGADILDIGAYSSRPGAIEISETEEKARLAKGLKVIRKQLPEMLISVDTFRSGIAEYAVKEYGVNMVNDISAGLLDEKMFRVVGSAGVPYIMMHMKGTPGNMQVDPRYGDVVRELIAFFAHRINVAQEFGIKDIIIDPGFGFGKTLKDNYTILNELKLFEILGYPLMAGLSRKSMIYKPLHIKPADALNGTTVLNTMALSRGARILRVHDVQEAVQTVRLVNICLNTGDI